MKLVAHIHPVTRIIMILTLSIPMAWASGTIQAQAGDGAKPRSLADLKETPTPGLDIPADLGAQAVRRATAGGLPVESRGNWGMSPHATPAQVQAALKMAQIPDAPGPVEETWQSVHDNYRIPDWMVNGKLGIFIHFGLYSLPAHGSIPEDQQQCLRAIGQWLKVNGEAIYGTRAWAKSGEGALRLERRQRYSAKEIRFTTKGGVLYAVLMAWPPSGQAIVTSLPAGAPTGKPTAVSLVGSESKLEFGQDAEGLKIQLPPQEPGIGPHVLRLAGLHLP